MPFASGLRPEDSDKQLIRMGAESGQDKIVQATMLSDCSFVRYFLVEEPEACPLFNFIFAAFYDEVLDHWNNVPSSVVGDAVETLKRFPLDRIDWGYKNSHRLDIVPLGRHILEGEGKAI